MKKFHLSHPMFMPFYDLDKSEVIGLIKGVNCDFKTVIKNSESQTDYSGYFKKWNELVSCVELNHVWIYNECGFSGKTYEESAFLLLQIRLKDILESQYKN